MFAHQADPPACAVDDDGEPVARGGDDLLAQQCSAQSFDQIERAAFHLVRPIDREIDLPVFAERGERNSAAAACAAVRSEVGMPTKRRPCR